MLVEFTNEIPNRKIPYTNFLLNKKRIGFVGSGPSESWIGIFDDFITPSYIVVKRFKNKQTMSAAKKWLRDFFEPLPIDVFTQDLSDLHPIDLYNWVKETYHSNK